jgi:hypothetical protein
MIARITSLHAALPFTLLLTLGALAVWGLGAAAFRHEPGRLYRSGLLIGQLLLLAEALLGVLLLASGLRPAQPELHVVYALVALAVLPAAHRYGRELTPRQQGLMYALACLFLCAVVLRGLETGRSPEQPAGANIRLKTEKPPLDNPGSGVLS